MCQPSLNDETREQMSKWCGLSNRFGLFVLVWFKVVLNVGLLYILICSMYIFFMFGRPLYLYHVVLLSIAIFLDVVDIIIGLVTIISICVKCHEIMELYYLYSIHIFSSITVLCCLVYYIIHREIFAVFILFLIFLFFIIMQMWLNYVMKKEVLLQRSSHYNNP